MLVPCSQALGLAPPPARRRRGPQNRLRLHWAVFAAASLASFVASAGLSSASMHDCLCIVCGARCAVVALAPFWAYWARRVGAYAPTLSRAAEGARSVWPRRICVRARTGSLDGSLMSTWQVMCRGPNLDHDHVVGPRGRFETVELELEPDLTNFQTFHIPRRKEKGLHCRF